MSPDSEPLPKRRRLSELSPGVSNQNDLVRLYCAELVVYDRHCRCLLIDGDYELTLPESTPSGLSDATHISAGTEKSPRKGTASWNALDPPSASDTALVQGPTLKFRLEWTNAPIPRFVDRYY